MTAMEKVAWTELLISLFTMAMAAALYPWLGNGAAGAFGFLGFVACGILFLRKRGNKVVVDERDREIERQATQTGIHTAWMILFMALIVIVLWASQTEDKVIATGVLMWLVWIQFAILYGVKGLVAVLLYRSQRRAT